MAIIFLGIGLGVFLMIILNKKFGVGNSQTHPTQSSGSSFSSFFTMKPALPKDTIIKSFNSDNTSSKASKQVEQFCKSYLSSGYIIKSIQLSESEMSGSALVVLEKY